MGGLDQHTKEKMDKTGKRRRMEQGTTLLFECMMVDGGGYNVIRSPRDEAYDEEIEDELDAELEQMAMMGLPVQFGAEQRLRTAEMHREQDQAHRVVTNARRESTGLHDIGKNESCAMSHVRFDDQDGRIHIAPQANKNMVKEQKKQRRRRLPCIGPDGIHDHRILQKYWLQRYSIFSLFDNGIMMDEEGWYSATPEIIAWHHASMVARTHGPGCVVLDAFGGVGGNAIQLALAGCHVIVTELCPHRASIIKNNSRVYGVENAVEVICGNALACAPNLLGIDVVLLSPPWGGPEYAHDSRFDVEFMGGNTDLSFGTLVDLVFKKMSAHSALFWLPRNSDMEQIGIQVLKNASTHSECHIELSKINGRQKGISVYIGRLGDFVSKFNSRYI